jgi:hypothetical protein
MAERLRTPVVSWSSSNDVLKFFAERFHERDLVWEKPRTDALARIIVDFEINEESV